MIIQGEGGRPALPDIKLYSFFKKKYFIYLFMKDTHTERQRHRHREKQAPYREPDVGLDPKSSESHPGLKAALNH